MAPIVPGSRLEPPVLDSTLPPVTASESTWEELRAPSSIEPPDAADPDLSRHWHREVMIVEGVPYDPERARMGLRRHVRQDTTGRGLCTTGLSRTRGVDTGVIYSTPSRLPAIREESPNSQTPVIPQIIVEENQESPNASMLDGSTCLKPSVEHPLETKSLRDALVVRHPVADDSTRGRLAISESATGDLDAGISTVHDSSGDSTPSVVPEGTEHPESPIGGTPDLLQIQIDLRDLEGNSALGSAASASWVGFVALRDSLIHLGSNLTAQNRSLSQDSTDGTAHSTMEDIDDFSPISQFAHDNAWANDNVD
ncbi:hypothetical protein FRC11_003104, partial [Ceratobasidium sp. 423]